MMYIITKRGLKTLTVLFEMGKTGSMVIRGI